METHHEHPSQIRRRRLSVARSSKINADTDPSEIVAIVNLVEDLETLLDRLAAEHQAVTTINTAAADVEA
jgi:hypothetical protein